MFSHISHVIIISITLFSRDIASIRSLLSRFRSLRFFYSSELSVFSCSANSTLFRFFSAFQRSASEVLIFFHSIYVNIKEYSWAFNLLFFRIESYLVLRLLPSWACFGVKSFLVLNSFSVKYPSNANLLFSSVNSKVFISPV